MSKYFEVKLKYSKIDEQSGKEKVVTEPYLIDATSFTEAESIMTKKASEMAIGEFIIPAIKKSNYIEVIRSNEEFDKWFSFKVVFVGIDENSCKEKEVSSMMLVNANDIDSSKTVLAGFLDTNMFEYKTEAIKETKIVDVYDYSRHHG